MATFREAREALLFAYQDGSIDDTEFALLYDLNSSENLEFPYWKYGVLVDGTEALSVLLKRSAYPCRFADMVALFG